ncbi:hypothetical protein P3T35_007466 [Kitasatospora sp. GP30]|uniref:hypothetical protein n=1 Tax=Kitasatospora sp. GP30 TaxID=3035084 RepID=UPI000C71596A|nr:hypothetical protein [Kitasatospora sp. GP30]MDH6145411.1 hypothetical protein [Kitasatospora sp. GP30]
MARSIAAAFLADSSWGGGSEQTAPGPRPPIDWVDLRKRVEAYPSGSVRITIGADGKLLVFPGR